MSAPILATSASPTGHQRSRDHHASARLLSARRSREAPRRTTLAVRPNLERPAATTQGIAFGPPAVSHQVDRVGDLAIISILSAMMVS